MNERRPKTMKREKMFMNDKIIEIYGPRGTFAMVPAEYNADGKLQVVEQDSECGEMMWNVIRGIVDENHKLRDEVYNLKFKDYVNIDKPKWWKFWK